MLSIDCIHQLCHVSLVSNALIYDDHQYAWKIGILSPLFEKKIINLKKIHTENFFRIHLEYFEYFSQII